MASSILLLDDEQSICTDLGARLRRSGLIVHTADNLRDAAKIVLAGRLDYAVVDLKIDWEHEFSGLKAINFIKKSQPQVKVIILSAYPQCEDITRGLEVDVEGYVEKGGAANYIAAVLTTLSDLSKRSELKKCFVIMPFSTSKSCKQEEWTEIFKTLVKPAVEKAGFGYVCERSSARFGNIIEDILDNLNRADVVIADMTDQNPNVFYELGVRHALRNATILIAQNLDDIPFDLRPYAAQTYNWKLDVEKKLFMKRIKQIISLIENEPIKAESPVHKYLKL